MRLLFPSRDQWLVWLLIPGKRQWKKWSLPSKLTFIGTYAGILGVLLAVATILVSALSDPPTPPPTADEIAITVLEKQKGYKKTIVEQEEAITALKTTIEDLQQEPANKLKADALKALAKGDTTKAIALLEKATRSRAQELAKDWINIGNIAYFSDSNKALKAYQEAVKLDSSNSDGWNRLGHILKRTGRMEEAEKAYKQVLELAGDDKSIKAVAYGNLGIIHKTRGDLDKACESWRKSLKLFSEIGAKHMAQRIQGWIDNTCGSG